MFRYVKIFRDIPQADLETIYPCKNTRMSPIALVQFIGVAISGVISLLMQRQGGDTAGFSALMGVAGLFVAVLFNYEAQMSLYRQYTLGDVYRKTKDADKGAVNYVIEEVCAQEVKEVLLAFWFLSQSSTPQTPKELDEKVEDFLFEMQTLYESSESSINFEVGDALEKLREMKLVTESGGAYTAISLIEGVETLSKVWETVPRWGEMPTRIQSGFKLRK